MKRRWETRGTRRRRRSRDLWWLLGLTALGVALGAAVALGRRRELAGFGDENDGRRRPDRPPPEPAEPFAADTQVWIAGPAGNLYVRDGGAGDGLPVLFIHSLGGNGGQWALQLDHLRRHPRPRRAIALDLRGHGESDPADDGDYSVEGFGGDVAAAADQLGLRRFVLAGHSFGGSVAIEYAGRHPERVAGLLLVDPSGDQSRIPPEQTAPLVAALRADPLAETEWQFRQMLVNADPAAAQWVLEDLRSADENAIVGAIVGSLAFQPLPLLARYPGPRLAVISDLNVLPVSLHNLVADLPVRLFRGTGHWLQLDRPEPFNHLLDEFLESVEGG